MKKLLVLLALCMVLTVALVACNNDPGTTDESTAGTTEAPTTEAPTTEAPTTEAPTTEEPTTEEPTTQAPTTEEPTTEPPVPVFEGNWHASVDAFMYCVNDDFSDVVTFANASTNSSNGTTITNAAQETLASVTANYVYFANGWLAVDGYAIENWAVSIYAEDGTLLKKIDLTLKEAEEGVVSHVSQNMKYAEGTVAHRVGNETEIISLKEFQNQNVTVVYSVGVVGTEFTIDLIKLDVAVPVDPNAPLFVLDAAAMAGATNMNETASITASADGTYTTFVGANDGQYGDAWVSLIASPTQAAQFIAIKYRTTMDRDGQIFIGSGQGPSGSGDCPMIDYTSDGKWQLAIVDLSTVTAVNAETYQINYLRYDFFTNGKDDATIDVAYIAAFNSVEAAEAYDAKFADVYVDKFEANLNNEQNADRYCTDWSDAGIITPFFKVGYDHKAYLGNLNLNDVVKAYITYSCDGSQTTADRFANATSLVIGLKSTNVAYGWHGQAAVNLDGDLGHTDMVFSEGGWTGFRTAEIDLTEVFYEGDVWVSLFNPEGTEVCIHSVVFVYGEKEAPIEPIFYDGTNGEVTVPAGGTVKFFIRNAIGMNMIINNANGLSVLADDLAGTQAPLEVVEGSVFQPVPDGWFTIELTLTNTTDADIVATLSFEDPNAGGDEPAGNVLVVGENVVTVTVTGYYCAGTEVTFTAEEAGTYAFSFTDDADQGELYYYEAPIYGMVEEMPLTLDLEAGQTITLLVGTGNIFMAEGGKGAVDVDVFVARI